MSNQYRVVRENRTGRAHLATSGVDRTMCGLQIRHFGFHDCPPATLEEFIRPGHIGQACRNCAGSARLSLAFEMVDSAEDYMTKEKTDLSPTEIILRQYRAVGGRGRVGKTIQAYIATWGERAKFHNYPEIMTALGQHGITPNDTLAAAAKKIKETPNG